MGDLLFLACAVTFAAAAFAMGRGVYLSAQKSSPKLVVVLSAASMSAGRRGQPSILAEHLLLLALCDPEVAAMFDASPLSLADVRARLLEHLPAQKASVERAVQPSPAIRGALKRAGQRARRHGRREITVVDVLASMTGGPALAAELLREAKLDFSRSLSAMPMSTEAATADEAYRSGEVTHREVRAWNDKSSKMEDVFLLFQDVFAMGADEATYAMFVVHHLGSAPVGVFSAEEAQARLERAEAKGRALGMALRFTLSKVAAPPRAGT